MNTPFGVSLSYRLAAPYKIGIGGSLAVNAQPTPHELWLHAKPIDVVQTAVTLVEYPVVQLSFSPHHGGDRVARHANPVADLTMCESLILVDNDADISAEALHSELLPFYADDTQAPTEITLSNQTIVLRWPDYQLEIAREQLPHVLEESAEIAERFASDHPDRERISSCGCRFATAGDDDPDMLHFNDYLFVGEAAERLGKVYRFDQSSCEFM